MIAGIGVGLIVWLALVWVTGWMADQRGRHELRWMVFGAVLSPIVAILCLGIAGDSADGIKRRQVEDIERARSSAPASPAQIKELAELRDAGLISAEEYQDKRAEILRRI